MGLFILLSPQILFCTLLGFGGSWLLHETFGIEDLFLLGTPVAVGLVVGLAWTHAARTRKRRNPDQ
jgi:hypothetical protein